MMSISQVDPRPPTNSFNHLPTHNCRRIPTNMTPRQPFSNC
jgi:hypothetical protein